MQKHLSGGLKSIVHFDHGSAAGKKDLPDVPKEAKKGLKFEFVKNTTEVLKVAIGMG
jgi:ATP-dependent Lon protease